MRVFRGIPHPPERIRKAESGRKALRSEHPWWSTRREIAAVWAGEGGTIVTGEATDAEPRGAAGIIDLKRGGSITITGKERT